MPKAKTIEDVKTLLTLKTLAGERIIDKDLFEFLKMKEVEDFVCALSPQAAYWYANLTGSSKKSREGACKDPFWAFEYAVYIDGKALETTRAAAYKDKKIMRAYIEQFGPRHKKKKKVPQLTTIIYR